MNISIDPFKSESHMAAYLVEMGMQEEEATQYAQNLNLIKNSNRFSNKSGYDDDALTYLFQTILNLQKIEKDFENKAKNIKKQNDILLSFYNVLKSKIEEENA